MSTKLSPTISQMAKDPGCHPKIIKDALTDEDALDRDVFLILGTSGSHSNTSNWVTGVFLELESARHYLLSLKEWFDSKGLEASAIFPDQVGVCLDGFEWGDLKEVAEREGRAHAIPLDPRACFEYDGITYRIINVPLRG